MYEKKDDDVADGNEVIVEVPAGLGKSIRVKEVDGDLANDITIRVSPNRERLTRSVVGVVVK